MTQNQTFLIDAVTFIEHLLSAWNSIKCFYVYYSHLIPMVTWQGRHNIPIFQLKKISSNTEVACGRARVLTPGPPDSRAQAYSVFRIFSYGTTESSAPSRDGGRAECEGASELTGLLRPRWEPCVESAGGPGDLASSGPSCGKLSSRIPCGPRLWPGHTLL